MSTLTAPHKGQRYAHDAGDTPGVFTVESVFRNPATGTADRVVEPFASGVWSEGGRGFVTLRCLDEEYTLIEE